MSSRRLARSSCGGVAEGSFVVPLRSTPAFGRAAPTHARRGLRMNGASGRPPGGIPGVGHELAPALLCYEVSDSFIR